MKASDLSTESVSIYRTEPIRPSVGRTEKPLPGSASRVYASVSDSRAVDGIRCCRVRHAGSDMRERTTVKPFAAFVVVGLAVAAPALGQITLSGSMTADNEFQASLSTSPTIAGPNWLTGNSWGTTYSGSVEIPSAGTYYLHVRAVDFGRPEMFIGQFSLSSTDAEFSNGTQSLLTNTTDWVVSSSAFGISTSAPVYLGDNGVSPWSLRPSISPSAAFIWAPEYANGVAYFTTVITVVPAPASVALAGLGLAAAFRRRR